MAIHHHFKNHNSGYLWPLIGVLAVVLIAWWVMGNTTPSATSGQGSGATQVSDTTVGAKKGGTDVVSVAQGISDASVFASWLVSSGVAAELAGSTYTLFVPTDAAIAALPAGTYRDQSAAGKKRFVEYYVVPGTVIDANATLAGSVQALSRDMLNFTKREGKPPLVGSAPIITSYKASNGVVYLIGGTLIPPKAR